MIGVLSKDQVHRTFWMDDWVEGDESRGAERFMVLCFGPSTRYQGEEVLKYPLFAPSESQTNAQFDDMSGSGLPAPPQVIYKLNHSSMLSGRFP